MAHVDVMALAAPEDRGDDEYTWFAVDPAVVYPAMLDYIQEARQEPSPADADLLNLYTQAQALSDDDFAAAHEDGSGLTKAQRERRAQALEIARQWFTRLLHLENGGPVGIHILKNETYRL